MSPARVSQICHWLGAGLALAAGLWLAQAAAPVQAQAGVTFLPAPPPTYEYGQAITFTVAAQSDAVINNLALHLAAPDGAQQQLTDIAFEPGQRVTATVTLNLAEHPVAPMAELTYWWVAEDEAGQRGTSAAATFAYDDNRFDWRAVGSGNLKVHWYSGPADFGQAALEVAAGSLARINQDIRAPLPPHQDIYIYASGADAKASLQRVGRAWADGHADPALGIIVVVVPADLRADVTLQREIPHEMTHVLIYKATGQYFGDVPLWLNEGLAVMNQGERDSAYAARLAAARDGRSFLPLESLCGAFPSESEAALLAYAQSESVVRYLRARYGSEGVYALLQAYGGGASCNTGLIAGLGLSLAELEANWLREAIYTADAPAGWAALGPWLVLTAVVLLAPFGALVAVLLARRPAKSA